MEKKKGRICVLATGGTIAGAAETPGDLFNYKSSNIHIDTLIANVIDGISEIAEIVNREQITQIDSQDMNDAVWLKLANRINELLTQDNIDGVVITHGTDTIEETAYFLNLVIKSRKPVVLVGSMRPSTAISADGPRNLHNAAAVAANQESAGRGVLVVLNDTIHCARAVSKTNTSLVNAFTSYDFGVMGYVLAGEPKFYTSTTRRHTYESEFDVSNINGLPKVDIVYAYAGSSAGTAINAFVNAGAKGLVIACAGNGGVSKETLSALDKARKEGIFVVRSTRVAGGIVTRNSSISDDEHDFVASDSLNPQKARILLQLVLLKNPDASAPEIQDYFYRY